MSPEREKRMKGLKPWRIALVMLGSLIQAVGIGNIHVFSDVTEGGVLGLTLLIHHWTGLTPALSSLMLNAACYLLGWRTLGREFLMYSIIASASYSGFYALLEPFAPLWPGVLNSMLGCTIIGAVFIGVGAGLSVRAGGAPSGDDALAMSLSRLMKKDIQWVYLVSDLIVLALSLTYIPWRRIAYSLLTVVLSGQIIGWVQKLPLPGEKEK